MKDAFINLKGFCDSIFDYAIYNHSLKMEYGTEKERMQSALHFYGITPGNLASMTRNGKEMVNNTISGSSFSSIEKDIIFDFYKNDKEEFDIACLCAFLAIKSIIGKRDYCKSNKAHIIARMFGYNSVKEVPESKTPLMKKYSNRYYIDKILQELQLNWHLKLFSDHCRGFYLSFDLSLDQLAKINVAGKKHFKIDKLKNAKKSALAKAKLSEMEYAFN